MSKKKLSIKYEDEGTKPRKWDKLKITPTLVKKESGIKIIETVICDLCQIMSKICDIGLYPKDKRSEMELKLLSEVEGIYEMLQYSLELKKFK